MLKQGHPLHRGRRGYSGLFLDVKVVIKVSEILIASFVSYKPLCLWSYNEQEYSSLFSPRISHRLRCSRAETYNSEFVLYFFFFFLSWSSKAHICTSPNENITVSVKRRRVTYGSWLIRRRGVRGGGWRGGEVQRMNSLSHEVAILPLSGIIIIFIFIIITTHTNPFSSSGVERQNNWILSHK